MLQLPPLTLYVHVPWCLRKCPYCDFNSHEAAGSLPEEAFVAALAEDLTEDLPAVAGRKLVAAFFGGGTPSLLSPRTVASILELAERAVGFAPGAEITLEANPAAADAARFAGYRAAGVNRLSIGVQSFSDRALAAIGRLHGGGEARAAVRAARRAGFAELNLDLMYGLPDQGPAEALADLRQALTLEPTHLSWYQLTLEPNTPFYKRPPPLPDEEAVAAMESAGRELLAEAGFARYEVSAYALPGHASRHNRNYWEFGDYLGIGPGAHGKLSDPRRDRIERTARTRRPADYLRPRPSRVARRTAVPRSERPLEFFLNALRLVEGVPRASFAARTGLPWAVVAARWEALAARGLLEPAGERLAATPTGYAHLDAVLAALASP
ncbi:MAG: YggW family oxidoreductase [Porticoccaceae bacterium]|nr:MAG: YggW family oxidoreductase [Porticoccaceae bacterium]